MRVSGSKTGEQESREQESGDSGEREWAASGESGARERSKRVGRVVSMRGEIGEKRMGRESGAREWRAREWGRKRLTGK